MQCEFCGEEVAEGGLACPRCGSPVSPAAVKEKPGATPSSADSPHPPAGAAERRPPAPPPRPEPTRKENGFSIPDTPGAATSPVPVWETPQPAEGPGPTAYREPPQLGPPGEPPPMPLAKQEEDFIALAEDSARGGDMDVQPPDLTPDVPAADGAPPGEVALTDGGAAPGVNAEAVTLEDDLTGGHKGGAFTGGTVAGAGEQTADDPFGLNVTETAPDSMVEPEIQRQFNWVKWRNIGIMLLAFLVAGAVAATGIYFGFLRKKTAPTRDPVETVEEFYTAIVSGDTSKLEDVSTPNSSYQKELLSIIDPYTRLGVLTMHQFEADATDETDKNATVEIKKFVVKSLNSEGETEYLDMLSIQNPAPLRTTVPLVKQNGKWMVSD